MKIAMYALKEGGMFVLRQTRYKEQLAAGREHPHDVCIVAPSLASLRTMTESTGFDADFSAVEALEPTT